MKSKKIVALGVFGFFLIPVSLFAATELARVNNTTITLEDFNKRFKDNVNYYQLKSRGKQAFLDDVIKRELGIQEARRLGLEKDPEVIERINTVLYQSLLEKKLAKELETIQVSDAEAKAYYSKYPELRTSHIFVSIPPGATAADEKNALGRIQKVYEDYVKDGKMSFSEIAQRFSEGTSAQMGGDIDYLTKDKLDPAYYEAALKLKSPGKISPIVKTQFGFHIIKLTAIRSWEDVDKAQIKRLVFDEKRSQVFENYMNQLRQKARISVKSALLKD